ncbi:ExbD/TolR family protein [Marinimicrobium agarilyticum]|uniref:ExbD/TolR family protein n=1 Tax=Marinimicrobium agarilyticum TaxID=306546 RepID=UPI000420A2F4|nr:biopolymer transporter ExbD [Marinimicrobium agarilyticum]
MNFNFTPRRTDDAELDVTSFMNLMVVLVPVLLITLTFAQVTVLDIHLPELTGGSDQSGESQSQLMVRIEEDGYRVYYPDDVLIQEVARTETEEGEAYDYAQLTRVMREVKKQLSDNASILLLSAPQVDYQSLVSTMDAVRSYEAVVAASVVEIELFPEISLGDIK